MKFWNLKWIKYCPYFSASSSLLRRLPSLFWRFVALFHWIHWISWIRFYLHNAMSGSKYMIWRNQRSTTHLLAIIWTGMSLQRQWCAYWVQCFRRTCVVSERCYEWKFVLCNLWASLHFVALTHISASRSCVKVTFLSFIKKRNWSLIILS